MAGLPSIAKLVENYPANYDVDGIAALIEGAVGANLRDPKYVAYKDTCAIRVSRALNYAGAPIELSVKGVRADRGGDKKWYIYSTYDMRKYLDTRYGKHLTKGAATTAADMADLKGIIGFGYLHIDLWDGSGCSRHCYFGDSRVKEIVLWKAT